MNISLFGFDISVEILILIGVIYLVMIAHTVGGCCNMNRIMEGLETIDSSDITKKLNEKMKNP